MKLKVFGKYHLILLKFLQFFLDFFKKISLDVVENVAKVEISMFFLFLAECNFSTLIDYSANMC